MQRLAKRAPPVPTRADVAAHQDRMLAAYGEPDRDWSDPRIWEGFDEAFHAQVREHAALGTPTIGIFGTGSARSRALLDELDALSRSIGFTPVLVPEPTSAEAVIASVRSADLTVVDCTVEPENRYRAVQYSYMSKYLLPVSCEPLPVNMPTFDPLAPTFPRRWSVERLLDEVQTRISGLGIDEPRETGADGFRGQDSLMFEGNAAIRAANQSRAGEMKVFFSYRGHHAAAVEDIVKTHAGGEGDGRGIKVFASGDLAPDGEVMTEQRRWQLFRQLRQWIDAAEEFWIYDTEDYLDSWWTRAELMALTLSDYTLPIYAVATDGTRRRLHHDDLIVEPSRNDFKMLHSLQYFAFQPEWLHRFDQPGAELIPPAAVAHQRQDVAQRLSSDARWMQCDCSGEPRRRFSLRRMPRRRRLRRVNVRDLVDFADPRLREARIRAEDSVIECLECGSERPVRFEGTIHWWYPFREFPDGTKRGTGPGGACLEDQEVWRLDDR